MTYTDEQVKEIAAVAWAADAELQAQHGDLAPSLPGDAGDADAHAVTLARVRAVLEGATPEELHERWRRAREAQGWTLGPKADSQRKTHPDLVPYAGRPEHLKARDRVFAAIVREVAGQDAPKDAVALDDFYFERKQVVELRAVLGEIFTCLDAGDPALLDGEQVAEWRERSGMEATQ